MIDDTPHSSDKITESGVPTDQFHSLLESYQYEINRLSSLVDAINDNFLVSGYIKLTDTKATTVAGGACTAGTQARALTTKDHDTGGHCALTGPNFTLDAGTYRILAFAPAFLVNRHKASLYNITSSSVEIIGSSEYSGASTGEAVTCSRIAGQFTILIDTDFRIDHYTQAVRAVNGLGVGGTDGSSEIYTTVELWKVG